MTKITRKLLLSIITVVLTVVALGTTTFAWFTLTNTSAVQPFEAEIVADSGIELALGDHATGVASPTTLNWVTTLTTDAIADYIDLTYGNNIVFNHVTTVDGVNFMTLGATAMTGTTSGYLEIPLNFRSDTATAITWSAVSLSSTVASWTADVAFTDATGTARVPNDQVDIDASNSMRIAMLSDIAYGGHVLAYEKPASTTNVVLDTGGDLSDLVALDDDDFGNAGAMNYYYSKNSTLPFGADSATTLTTVQAITGQTVITMVDVSASTSPDYEADYFGQVMIRVWLEGWDANAYNSILSRIISTSFEFTGA